MTNEEMIVVIKELEARVQHFEEMQYKLNAKLLKRLKKLEKDKPGV